MIKIKYWGDTDFMDENKEQLISDQIETERTILRHFKPLDVEDLYEYCSMDGVGEMAGWPKHTSIDYSMGVLSRYIKNKNMYAIVYKKNNKAIGHITIQKDLEEGRSDAKELGYVLNKDYWNRRIMTEVVKAVLKELFENCHRINYVYACCFQHNLKSKRLIEKCGFDFKKEGKCPSKMLHKTFDSYIFVYTRDMWNLKNNIM